MAMMVAMTHARNAAAKAQEEREKKQASAAAFSAKCSKQPLWNNASLENHLSGTPPRWNTTSLEHQVSGTPPLWNTTSLSQRRCQPRVSQQRGGYPSRAAVVSHPSQIGSQRRQSKRADLVATDGYNASLPDCPVAACRASGAPSLAAPVMDIMQPADHGVKSSARCIPIVEGALLKRAEGLTAMWTGAKSASSWRERHFRLDGRRGVLEYWLDADRQAAGAPPKSSLALERLVEVVQVDDGMHTGPWASRDLNLTFSEAGGGRRVLQVRVPETSDLDIWLSPLLTLAKAENAVEA